MTNDDNRTTDEILADFTQLLDRRQWRREMAAKRTQQVEQRPDATVLPFRPRVVAPLAD